MIAKFTILKTLRWQHSKHEHEHSGSICFLVASLSGKTARTDNYQVRASIFDFDLFLRFNPERRQYHVFGLSELKLTITMFVVVSSSLSSSSSSSSSPSSSLLYKSKRKRLFHRGYTYLWAINISVYSAILSSWKMKMIFWGNTILRLRCFVIRASRV